MCERPDAAWTAEFCLRPYNPYRLYGEPNPAFVHALDGRLLDFKDGRDTAIAAETQALAEALEQLPLGRGTVLVIVPGHEARPENDGTPLARLAQGLAAADARYIARINALIRTQTAGCRSRGGERTLQASVGSLRVTDEAGIRGRVVVILDDTVTTGNSVAAARCLLRGAGACRIAAVALARTVKYVSHGTRQTLIGSGGRHPDLGDRGR